jgi:DNA polymerase-3 subunit epsilon
MGKTWILVYDGRGSYMEANEFIALDFETANKSPNSGIAIGMVKFRDYCPVGSYYSLIRPPRLYIRPDFTAIHGLVASDVKDAPDFKTCWEAEAKSFIGDSVLAAHYAPFDTGVLRAVLEWHKLTVPKLSFFCTCVLARRTWPGLKSYSLTKLAKRFGIVYDAHNALEDALTCGKLVQMAAEKFGSGKSVQELLKAAGMGLKPL